MKLLYKLTRQTIITITLRGEGPGRGATGLTDSHMLGSFE
jgi:hypothetical protein